MASRFDPTDSFNGEELDRLFAQVDRRPFAQEGGASLDPSQDIGERADIPQDGVGIAQDIGFAPALVQFMREGLYNADFLEGPDGGADSAIDDEDNKLPGWFLYSEGTGDTTGTIKWVDEAGSPSGQGIEITFVDAVQNDALGLEQTVPLGTLGEFVCPYARWTSAAAETEFRFEMNVDYLKIDGTTTTGATLTFQYPPSTVQSGEDFLRLWSRAPSDARFVRFRIFFINDAAGADDDAVFTFWEASLTPPAYYISTYTCYEVDVGSGTSKRIRTGSQNPSGAIGGAMSVYMADYDGLFLSLSVHLNAARTAGSIAFSCDANDNVELIDNRFATIDDTNTTDVILKHDWDSDFIVQGPNFYDAGFYASNRLAVFMSPTSFTPTTADVTATVRCVMLLDGRN